MAELIYTRDNIISRGDVASVAVYVKAQWEDAWISRPELLCNSLEHTVQGVIGKAELYQRHGMIMQTLGGQRSANGFLPIDALDFDNWWIKIEYTPARVQTADPNSLTNTRPGMVVFNTTASRLERLTGGAWIPATDLSVTYKWYGVIVESRNEFFGADAGFAGDKEFIAYSLEYLLSKQQIFSTRMYDDGAPGTPREIPRGIPFNGGRSDGRSNVNNLIDNRSPKLGTVETPTVPPAFDPLEVRPIFGFAEDLKQDTSDPDSDNHNAIRWTITNIVDYLLSYYAPTDSNAPPWVLSVSSEMEAFLEAFEFIEVDVHGRMLVDVLNQVLDRRRGFTWWLEMYEDDIDPANDRILLKVDSYVAAPLVLTGTTQLPANERLYEVDWSNNRDARNSQRFMLDSAQSYNTVIVTGAHYGSVFSLKRGLANYDLKENWTSTDQTAYDLAASGDAGYTGLTTSQKGTANDTTRNSDRLSRVHTQFFLDNNWPARTYDNLEAFPAVGEWDAAIGPGTEPGLWVSGRRLNTFVLLKEGWDYTQDPPVDNTPDGSVADYLRPLAIARERAGSRWLYLDRQNAGNNDEILNSSEGLSISCSVTPLAEKPGISIRPNSVPHAISDDTAKNYNDRIGASSPNAYSDPIRRSEVDGGTIHCTVYMLHDRIISQQAQVRTDTIHNTDSTLHIRLGERAHFDVLCPNTILGIDNDGTSLITSPGTHVVLRDDRQLLKDIAITAAEWYSRDRASIDVSHDQIIGDYLHGSLIETLSLSIPPGTLIGHGGDFVVGHGGENVAGHGRASSSINSLITNVRHDFSESTTSVKTQFTELDFASLA